MSSFGKRLACSLFAFGVVLQEIIPPWEARAAGQDPPSAGGAEESAKARRLAGDRLLRFLELAGEELRKPEACPYDVEARAGALGGDIDACFTFIRDSILTEPYLGVLRGARGALSCRAGNSLDRALLLKELLEMGGHECRLVRGTLPPDRAEALLRAFLSRDPKQGPLGSPPEPSGDGSPEEVLRTLSEKAGVPREAIAEILDRTASRRTQFWRAAGEQIERQFAFLAAQLAEAGAKPEADPRTSSANLLERLKDHYWVRVKDPSSGEWINLDTAFGDSKRGAHFADGAKEVAKVPEGDRHRLEFSLLYRFQDGGKAKEEVLLRQSFPAAEALFEPLAFTIQPGEDLPTPSQAAAQDEKRLIERILKIKKFQAVLRSGDRSYGARPFDLEGNLYDVDSAGMIKGAQDIGKAVRGFGLGLGGDEEEKPARAFAELVVALRLEGPGAEPIAQSRTLLTAEDLKSPDYSPPLMSWEILVQPQVIPESMAAHETLKDLISNREAILDLLGLDPKNSRQMDRALSREVRPFPRILLPFVMSRQMAMSRILGRRAEVTLLVDAPNLFIAGHRLCFHKASGELFKRRTIDIVENRVSFLPRDEKSAPSAYEASLQQGIADSILEVSMFRSAYPAETPRAAATIFERARIEGRLVQVLKPRDAEALRALGFKERDVRWIQENEPESGLLLAVQAEEGEPAAWWSVSGSGRCVGRIGGGLGGDLAEYSLMFLKGVGWGLCLVEIYEAVHHPSHEKTLGVIVCVGLGLTSGLSVAISYHGAGAWAVVIGELAAFGFGQLGEAGG